MATNEPMRKPSAHDLEEINTYFNNADHLLICQVGLEMEKFASGDQKFPDTFHSLLDYIRQVNKLKTQSVVDEVLDIFNNCETIHQFEKACLVNLLPETVEEARALIPTLDVPDEDLQHILTNLKNTQNFVVD